MKMKMKTAFGRLESGRVVASVKNNVQYLLVAAFVLVAILAIGKSAVAQNPIPPDPSGRTQGSGIHFALPNSPYLPVTLNSSFPVTLTLSSVPAVVDLAISANPAIGSA